MTRSKLIRTTTLMVADVAFDYLRAGEHYNVTTSTRDGKIVDSVDVRRAYGDTRCGTYLRAWQFVQQVKSGNLHPVNAI